MPDDLKVKVLLKQTVLNGSSDSQFLQWVATVYINGSEYRVSAPPEAKGEALDWLPHFSVRQLADFNSEVQVQGALGVFVLRAVKKELETRKHEREEEPQLANKSQDPIFARLAIEEARKSVPENDGKLHPM